MIDKSEYAKWLAFEIDFNERYHNHKETMAWVATALYVSGIIVLGYKAGDIFKSFGWAVGTTVLVLLVACLIFCFVKMHFDMRWYAADAVHVLMRCTARLNSGAELPRPDEWAIDKEDGVWPHFVQREIDQLKTRRSFREATQASLNMVLRLWDEVDDRWKTELPSYVAIVIATLVSFVLIWYPYLERLGVCRV